MINLWLIYLQLYSHSMAVVGQYITAEVYPRRKMKQQPVICLNSMNYAHPFIMYMYTLIITWIWNI